MYYNLHVGADVHVYRRENGMSQGKVRWKGMLPGKDGYWIGIELASSDGKNDGTFRGNKYFQCKKFHGLFARPWRVRFPINFFNRSHSLQKRVQTNLTTLSEAQKTRTSAHISRNEIKNFLSSLQDRNDSVEETLNFHRLHTIGGVMEPATIDRTGNIQTKNKTLSICLVAFQESKRNYVFHNGEQFFRSSPSIPFRDSDNWD